MIRVAGTHIGISLGVDLNNLVYVAVAMLMRGPHQLGNEIKSDIGSVAGYEIDFVHHSLFPKSLESLRNDSAILTVFQPEGCESIDAFSRLTFSRSCSFSAAI